MPVFTCTNFICMYPCVCTAIKNSTWKKFLESCKLSIFTFLLCLKPVFLWILYLFISMHFRKYLSRLLTSEPSQAGQILFASWLFIREISSAFNVKDTTRDVTRAWALLQRESDWGVWPRTSTRLVPPPWPVLLLGTWAVLPVPPWNKSAMVIIPCSSHLS